MTAAPARRSRLPRTAAANRGATDIPSSSSRAPSGNSSRCTSASSRPRSPTSPTRSSSAWCPRPPRRHSRLVTCFNKSERQLAAWRGMNLVEIEIVFIAATDAMTVSHSDILLFVSSGPCSCWAADISPAPSSAAQRPSSTRRSTATRCAPSRVALR